MKPGFAVALLIAIAACSSEEHLTEVAAPPPSLNLVSSQVLEEAISTPILGTGTIAAHKKTDVSPLVDGVIEEIFVIVGARVAKGDRLFRTRQSDYKLSVDQARANVRLAVAETGSAKRDLERTEKLADRQVASVDQLDDARTRREITSARAASARAALARAEQDLTDTVVRAPYDGVVTARHVDEGVFMRTMMSGKPVVQVMKTDIVAAIVFLPEVNLPRIHVGMPARVRIDGVDREYESEVYILNDRVEHRSHSVEVRLPIRNDDLAIKPGLFAKAELLPEPELTTTAPRVAVLGVGRSRYAFVEVDGLATRRDVEIRELDAGRVRVISGLKAGERVLHGPDLPRVREGAVITIEMADVAL